MARLFEYQGKKILTDHGLKIPAGSTAKDPKQAYSAAEKTGKPVVIKAQVFTTKRKDLGLVKFADTPKEAEAAAKAMFGAPVGQARVETVLVEEKLDIDREFYIGLIVDDSEKCLRLLASSKGGTGIEEIAASDPSCITSIKIDITKGLRSFDAANMWRRLGFHGKTLRNLASAAVSLYKAARSVEARSAEVNPLVLLKDGSVCAADCRIAVDDYAVFRHPELGIEIAREFDRPPTELEKIAYKVEANDYRGTFYFIQMEEKFTKKDNVVGFHGAGGGGSMMSMDALLAQGFKIANFCDTSGNPPAGKVYRAAKIIMSQPNITGYFGSGSGVASQEQFHSARGLVKAFLEDKPNYPIVIRLGGNQEDLAVEILEKFTKNLPYPAEGFKKDDSPEKCAARLKERLKEKPNKNADKNKYPAPIQPDRSFKTLTGRVEWESSKCLKCKDKPCISACTYGVLKIDQSGVPALAIDEKDAAKGKCTECVACELECQFSGNKGLRIVLPIEGLEEYRKKKGLS